MIVVAGTIDLPAAAAEEVAGLARAVMAETRKEDGCRVYNMTADLERPGRIHVYEEWESFEHLRAHGKTAHLAEWRAGLARLGVEGRDVRWMEAGEPTVI